MKTSVSIIVHSNCAKLDRETVEQERYYARLRRATQKQTQIFQQHLNHYFLPQKVKEKQLVDEEENRIRRLKMQAAEFEKQQRSNIRTIKDEYSEFLSNQMKEKQFTEEIKKHEKQKYHDDIKMKYQLLQDTEKRHKLEKMENQLAYRDVLHEQERFKNVYPERALKVTDSPNKSDMSKVSGNQYNKNGLNHYPSASSIKNANVPSQNIEPVGPIDANIGHRSNYRGPNPILTPVSDPLYNPYVRREVTNSLHDPKKKSIYIPPNSFAF